jgi:hypothetical protein
MRGGCCRPHHCRHGIEARARFEGVFACDGLGRAALHDCAVILSPASLAMSACLPLLHATCCNMPHALRAVPPHGSRMHVSMKHGSGCMHARRWSPCMPVRGACIRYSGHHIADCKKRGEGPNLWGLPTGRNAATTADVGAMTHEGVAMHEARGVVMYAAPVGAVRHNRAQDSLLRLHSAKHGWAMWT